MTARPEPGPLPEEAARLVGAALEWARRAVPADWAGHAECAGCPLCRAVRAVQDDSPELNRKLTTVVTEVAAAASGLFQALSDLRESGPDETTTASDGPAPPSGDEPVDRDDPSPPRVQRIDIR